MTDFFVIAEDEQNNRHYSDPYLSNLYGDISWNLNDIFKDKETELRSANIDGLTTEEVDALISTGHTKDTADNDTRFGSWYKPINSDKKVHTFNKLYKKIMCCLNKDELDIPYIAEYKNGEPQYKHLKIQLDVSNQSCTYDDTEWWDDNTTKANYNENCLKLFKKLLAFLKMYDPTNPMIGKFGGCIDDDLLPLEPVGVRTMINSNRKCGPLSEHCGTEHAFKRERDRESCNLTFCDQSIEFDDISAGGNAVFENISQTCGPDTKVGAKVDAYNNQQDLDESSQITDNLNTPEIQNDPEVQALQTEIANLRNEATEAIEQASSPTATPEQQAESQRLQDELSARENDLRLLLLQKQNENKPNMFEQFLENPFNLEIETNLYIYISLLAILLLSSSSVVALAM